MAKFLTALFFVALAAGAGWYYLEYGLALPMSGPQAEQGPVSDFISCMRQYPARGAQPRTCTDNLGIVYTEDLGNAAALQNKIYVSSPKPNDVVSPPINIAGKAVGSWYNNMDGTFAIALYDSSGNLLGKSTAQAINYWVTTDFVPYRGTVPYEVPRTATVGKLVLTPDSGGTALVVPVLFK